MIVGAVIAIAGCSKPPVSKVPVLEKVQASEVQQTPDVPKVLLPPPPPPHAKMTVPDWAKGKVIRQVDVKPGVKVVALTFDDGPWPKYTHQVLKVLKQHHVKATFFMVGEELSRRPQIGRDVVSAGHVIGNHSWDHPARPRRAVDQVKHTDSEIHQQLRIYTHLFRPPYGLLKNGMAEQAKREKHAVIMWSADSEDWRRPAASHIARTVIRETYPGGIILMHDGGGNRSRTVAALSIIIPKLKKKGYKFVTIPELLEMRYVPPKKEKDAEKKSK